MKLLLNLIQENKSLVAKAKEGAIRSFDNHRTIIYWHNTERIFNEEQQGKERADYGNYLIKYISEKLQSKFGSEFYVRQLERYLQFYRIFSIAYQSRTQLSWSPNNKFLSADNEDKREYYSAETFNNNWSFREGKTNKQPAY